MSLDLAELNLPADLEILRDRASAALQRGEDLSALYAELAEKHPMALLDLAMGPKALDGKLAVLAALTVLDALEGSAKPQAVARRLVQLGAPTEVLEACVARHGAAAWLEAVAAKTPEGDCALAGMLLGAGHTVEALELSAAILVARPTAPLVLCLQHYEPDCAAFVARLVPRLRTRAAAENLREHTATLPSAQALLDLVLPGMVG
jgi:hypothetical protein